MNYYEELGVSPAAPAEEIRHSYKTLARLLHPDRFTDAAMNRMAELQMRRLNRIFSVLSDPEERRRYNLQLQGPAAVRPRGTPERAVVLPPVDRPWLRPLTIGLLAWLPPAAVLIAFFAAVMYYTGGVREAPPVPTPDSRQSPYAAAQTAASPALRPAGPVAAAGFDAEDLLARFKASQRELQTLRAERQQMTEQLALMARPQSREPSIPDPPQTALRFLPQEASPAAMPTRIEAPTAEGPAPSRFAGNWYYVPVSRGAPPKGMYLPQYIELRLTEGAGVVRGRYRALYRITDQAISPEVAFQFEGAGKIPIAQLPWTGPGEARGNVTLRLVSADRLEVSWIASQLSADLNLASGSAQLVRQREP